MTKDPYRNIASLYDLSLEPLNKGLRGLGLKLQPPRPGMKVLDVCCGTGVHLDLYRQGGSAVYGVDLSPSMLSVARARLGEEASLVRTDVSVLPFNDGMFDLVICMLALHEMDPDHRVSVVQEMMRVLKPKAHLQIIDFQPGPYPTMKGKFANIIITIAEFLAGKRHFANSREFLSSGGVAGLIPTDIATKKKEKIVAGGTLNVSIFQKGE